MDSAAGLFMIAPGGVPGNGANKVQERRPRLSNRDTFCKRDKANWLSCQFCPLDMPLPIPRHDESFRRPRRRLAVGLIMMISAARRFRSTLQSSYPNGAARTAENKAVIFLSVDNRIDFSLYEKLCHRFRAFHWILRLLICAPWVCSVWQIFTKRELSGFSVGVARNKKGCGRVGICD